MLKYLPNCNGIEDVLNHKENLDLVMKIDDEFFSSCVRELEHEEKLQKALNELRVAGEPEIANDINKYLYAGG